MPIIAAAGIPTPIPIFDPVLIPVSELEEAWAAVGSEVVLALVVVTGTTEDAISVLEVTAVLADVVVVLLDVDVDLSVMLK